MTEKIDINDSKKLKAHAERQAASRIETDEDLAGRSTADIARLVHELRVHQIELTVQNEELLNIRNELESARDRYAHLYDFAPVGYFTLDASGTIVAANLTAAVLLDRPRADVVGRMFSHWIHPEDRDRWCLHCKGLLEDGAFRSCRLRLLKKNGTPLAAELECMSVKGGDGGTRQIQIAAVDITARLEVEKRQQSLQAQLYQANKMESIGRLAGGVAHDNNNFLSIIIGYAELSLELSPPGHPLHDNLVEILNAANRSKAVTRQLLAFARKDIIVSEVLDLNDALENMLRMIRQLIGEHIELDWHPGSVLWPVKMDPAQIDQILANLCINARDAITGAGRITIETGKASVGAEMIVQFPHLVPGDYVTLSVSDNGSGMDPATVERIFEPYFTTKEMGRGTGLGLATVYGIIKQNHGYIHVQSEPGNGTRVIIHLPRYQKAPVPVDLPPQIDGAPQGSGQTILLVEDQPQMLNVAEKVLERLGYRVLAAQSPIKALEIARAQPSKAALLITDLVMPEMNGRELAKRLKAHSPQLKCLFMSGYRADVNSSDNLSEAGVHFIGKPFLTRDLAAKIKAVLEEDDP